MEFYKHQVLVDKKIISVAIEWVYNEFFCYVY